MSKGYNRNIDPFDSHKRRKESKMKMQRLPRTKQVEPPDVEELCNVVNEMAQRIEKVSEQIAPVFGASPVTEVFQELVANAFRVPPDVINYTKSNGNETVDDPSDEKVSIDLGGIKFSGPMLFRPYSKGQVWVGNFNGNIGFTFSADWGTGYVTNEDKPPRYVKISYDGIEYDVPEHVAADLISKGKLYSEWAKAFSINSALVGMLESAAALLAFYGNTDQDRGRKSKALGLVNACQDISLKMRAQINAIHPYYK